MVTQQFGKGVKQLVLLFVGVRNSLKHPVAKENERQRSLRIAIYPLSPVSRCLLAPLPSTSPPKAGMSEGLSSAEHYEWRFPHMFLIASHTSRSISSSSLLFVYVQV